MRFAAVPIAAAVVALFTSCTPDAPAGVTGEGKPAEGKVIVTLRGACDASAAAALDERTFVVADDENNILRVYSLDAPGMPLAEFPMGRFLQTNVQKHPEADIEACTRVGDRIYWITSHGRSKKGKWRRSRYLFFATEVIADKAVPGGYRLEPVGSPSRDILEALLGLPKLGPTLKAAVGLIGEDGGKGLAPKEAGLNIEGLAADASGEVLYMALRNPRPGGKAVVVPLLNAAGLVEKGEAPRLGEPVYLDFGGRGVRSFEYAPAAERFYAVAGSHKGGGVSTLYSWAGPGDDAPELVGGVPGLNPEALAPVPGVARLQLFSDDGTVMVDAVVGDSFEPLEDGQCACKTLKDPRKKSFRAISRSIAPATSGAGGG